MRGSKSRTLSAAASALAAALLCSSAWSADPAPSSSSMRGEPSRELREKMAVLHEQMAACLRSDKSFSECRTEMRSRCMQQVGTEGCQMMGRGRGRILQQQSPPK